MNKNEKKEIKEKLDEVKQLVPLGRPPVFTDPEALMARVEQYFTEMEEKKKPFTITGLALYLKTNRMTLLNYSHKDEYADIIDYARLRCQNYAEEFLYAGKNVVGAIFNLKNNYGWKDKSEIDGKNSTDISVTINKEK